MGQIQGTINQAVVGSSIAVGYAKHNVEAQKANQQAKADAAQRKELAQQRFEMEGMNSKYEMEQKLQDLTDTLSFYDNGLQEIQADIENQQRTIEDKYKIREDLDTNVHKGLPINDKQLQKEGFTKDEKGIIKNKEGKVVGGKGLLNKEGMREMFGVTDYDIESEHKALSALENDFKAETSAQKRLVKFIDFVTSQAQAKDEYYGTHTKIPSRGE